MTQPTLVRRSVGSMERFISDTQVVVNFEPTLAANNSLILCIQLADNTDTVSTVVDNKSNSGWGTLSGPIGSGTTAFGDMWGLFGAAAGTSQITVTLAGAAKLFRSCHVFEYAFLANGTVASVKDATTQTNVNASSPVSPSAALAPVTDGDLIFQWVVDGNGNANGNAPTHGTGFSIIGSQGIDGNYMQHFVQGTHANITPALTIPGGLTAYVTICVALKADPTKGSATYANSVEMVGQQAHNSQSGTSFVLPFPNVGTTLSLRAAQGALSPANFITGVTDTKGNSWALVPGSKIDNGNTQQTEQWAALNATPSDNNVVTVNYSVDTINGPGMIVLSDIVGCGGLGAVNTAQGTQSVNANLAGISLACQNANSLVMGCGGINNHTAQTVVPATGVWSTDVDVLPSSNGANESMDEADPYWHYKPGTTASQQSTWVIQNNNVAPIGVGTWAQSAVEFLPTTTVVPLMGQICL